MTRTVNIKGTAFRSAAEALQDVNATGFGVVISLNHGYFVTSQEDADRLEAARASFAYIFDHELPDGTSRIVTVPVN